MKTSLIEPLNRREVTRSQLINIARELSASGAVSESTYLSPTRTNINIVETSDQYSKRLSTLVESVNRPKTGTVIFWGDPLVTVVIPPFPVIKNVRSLFMDSAPLIELLNQQLQIGVILIRLGRYAIGILQGETLLSSKTDTRYVKSRHRAGGSSQRRFERSRERLIRELYDKVCEEITDVLQPFKNDIDHILIGGEKHTVSGLLKRCTALQKLSSITLQRRLNVRTPNQKQLEDIHKQVWSSQMFTFNKSDLI